MMKETMQPNYMFVDSHVRQRTYHRLCAPIAHLAHPGRRRAAISRTGGAEAVSRYPVLCQSVVSPETSLAKGHAPYCCPK
jgi:hypothetical protein